MKRIILNVPIAETTADKKCIKVTGEPAKAPKNRKITEDDKWRYDEITGEEELDVLRNYARDGLMATEREDVRFMSGMLNGKIGAYRSQDRAKGKYNSDAFITRDQVVTKLLECGNVCYYCKNRVKVFYAESRDPMQWTLERVNNDFGHNNDNVVIACLQCNVERRTMYQGRYQYAAEFKKVVKTG